MNLGGLGLLLLSLLLKLFVVATHIMSVHQIHQQQHQL